MKNRLYICILLAALFILSSCSVASDSSAAKSEGSDSSVETTTGSDVSSVIDSLNSSETSSSDTSSASTTTTTKTDTPATTKAPSHTNSSAPATTTAPVKVVVPRVYTPSSPGKEKYSCSVATIDVSNKSQGYFTVRYTGSKSLVKVLVQKDGTKFQYTIKTNGAVEVLPLQLGSGTYTIGVYENISGTSYSVALQKSVSVSISNSHLPFLYPNQQVNFSQGSACVYKAAQLCAGKTTDVQKVSAIFKFVAGNVTYDTAEANRIKNGTLKNYCPYPDEVLSTRKGICYDYASLVAAMCRSQGIPTKLVKGYVGPSGLYHAWNQIYITNVGWITVEYKARTGFNTVDATFYSSASNKSSVTANFNNSSYYKVYQVF